jgi:uncharacterized protein (TIGR02996 family)
VERVIPEILQAGALLEYVCQDPSDDVARLAYADALEERGEDARAEFVRVQVELWARRDEYDSYDLMERGPTYDALQRREWELLEAHWQDWLPLRPAHCANLLGSSPSCGTSVTFRRGFPCEVSLTAESFAGGSCGRCSGSGWVRVHDGFIREDGYGSRREDCPACRGEGKTPGHAAALFRGAPIERVTLRDREPVRVSSGLWEFVVSDDPTRRNAIPWELFDLFHTDRLTSREAAFDALASATLLLGRRRGWPCDYCCGTGEVKLTERVRQQCKECHGLGHTVEV